MATNILQNGTSQGIFNEYNELINGKKTLFNGTIEEGEFVNDTLVIGLNCTFNIYHSLIKDN